MYQVVCELSPSIFSNLIQTLQDKPLEINKYRKNSGLGRSQAFGIVKQRDGTYSGSRQNFYRMDIFKELFEIAKHLPTDFQYDGIQVNDNYQTKAHKDAGNKDLSAIIGFGDYQGGELIIEETPVDIKHKIVLFDGSIYVHSTAPYTGCRYSIVFFKVKATFNKKPSYSLSNDSKGRPVLVEEFLGITRVFDKKGSNIFSSDGQLIQRQLRRPTLSRCLD